jgi:N-acetylmuramoyl-L-alanine amidase
MQCLKAKKTHNSVKSYSYIKLFLLVVGCTLFMASDDPQKTAIRTVVIDAGHGGKDPGCSGVKAKEKHVALSIALKLGKYISDNYPSIKVIYTRKTDVFIELHERAKIANRNKADLFISIHCNANSNTQPYGTETYVMGLHKSTDNLGTAKRENASILLEENYDTHYDGFDPNSAESHIMFSLFQNAFLHQSIAFASGIQTQFKEKAKRRSRGVHQAGFLVLYRTTMPSVLVETGFLTNRTEEKYLASEAGQTYIASAIYRAFKEYKFSMDGIPFKAPTDTAAAEAPVVDTIATLPIKQDTVAEQPKPEPPPIKPVEVSPEEVEFRVQFLSIVAPLAKNDPRLDGIPDIKISVTNGWTKYTAGAFKTAAEATTLQKELRENGYPDAFVVAFKGGKRIPMSEVN